jgi:hypothetical protein
MALPYLDAMIADAAIATDVPTRMVCVGFNFGLIPRMFFPTRAGRD